jgi:hypothetical protein
MILGIGFFLQSTFKMIRFTCSTLAVSLVIRHVIQSKGSSLSLTYHINPRSLVRWMNLQMRLFLRIQRHCLELRHSKQLRLIYIREHRKTPTAVGFG